jgi:peptide-methionine (R)-S-oxide reductase
LCAPEPNRPLHPVVDSIRICRVSNIGVDMDLSTLSRRQLFATCAGGATALLLASTADAAAFEVSLSPAQWRQKLGAQRYAVLREAATERPGSSPLLDEHRKGVFACAGCGLPLFASATKFDSGTGWPSFYQPLPHAVVTRKDATLGTTRTEVLCRRCGGHLGHVFDDGPKPTGLRYCMNGIALTFKAA